MAKTGWNRPLAIELSVRKPEIASSMQAGFDKSGLIKRSGRLRAELGKIPNYKIAKAGRGGMSARITVILPLVYARILNEGGTSPFPAAGRPDRQLMSMPWGVRYRRKPSRIRPYRYLEGGVEEFVHRYALEGGISVRWKK